MIFDKVELFSIRGQLFEYSNSIRFLKSNEYEYEYHYSWPTIRIFELFELFVPTLYETPANSYSSGVFAWHEFYEIGQIES